MTGIAATLLAWRGRAAREIAHGEFFALLLTASAGMIVLAGAQNLVSTFIGLELLSLPLYILCAARLRSERSLESGPEVPDRRLGRVGDRALRDGDALRRDGGDRLRRRSPSRSRRQDLAGDGLFLAAIAMITVGFAFKASLAPFHQWTPDVYEGAPTSVTAFMSVATKVAAFGAIIRLYDVALISAVDDWRPVWITIALISILVGNVGALGQASLKRMLAYSSIAQAGYLLVGVVVVTDLGVQAVLFYLAVYLLANVTAFAVVILRERETPFGDDMRALHGLGERRPLMALAMTLVDAEPRRDPRDRRLHRQVPPDRGRGRRRLHVAGHRDRHRLDDLARLLPARGRRDVARRAGAEPGVDPLTGRAVLAGAAPRRVAGGGRPRRRRRRGRSRVRSRGQARGAAGRRRDPLLRHPAAAALRPRRDAAQRPRARVAPRRASRSARIRRMRLSAKADYAVRAAVELAAAPDGPVKGETIAATQGISLKFLENILAELRRAGIVASRRGSDGGYWLAKPADEISVADVMRAVEGPLATVRGEAPERVRLRAPPRRCRACGSRCAAACAPCSSASRSPTSSPATCRADVERLAGDPESWVTR